MPYLGANVPQAWAAGSVFRFVAILCGLHATVDSDGSKLYVNPALPKWMPEITIRNLRLGKGSLDVHCVDHSVAVMSQHVRLPGRARSCPWPAGQSRRGRGRVTRMQPLDDPAVVKAPWGPEVDGRRLLNEAVGFGRALRAAGLHIDLGAAVDYARALPLVDMG